MITDLISEFETDFSPIGLSCETSTVEVKVEPETDISESFNEVAEIPSVGSGLAERIVSEDVLASSMNINSFQVKQEPGLVTQPSNNSSPNLVLSSNSILKPKTIFIRRSVPNQQGRLLIPKPTDSGNIRCGTVERFLLSGSSSNLNAEHINDSPLLSRNYQVSRYADLIY